MKKTLLFVVILVMFCFSLPVLYAETLELQIPHTIFKSSKSVLSYTDLAKIIRNDNQGINLDDQTYNDFDFSKLETPGSYTIPLSIAGSEYDIICFVKLSNYIGYYLAYAENPKVFHCYLSSLAPIVADDIPDFLNSLGFLENEIYFDFSVNSSDYQGNETTAGNYYISFLVARLSRSPEIYGVHINVDDTDMEYLPQRMNVSAESLIAVSSSVAILLPVFIVLRLKRRSGRLGTNR